MKLENQVCTFEQAKLLSEFRIGENYFPEYVYVPEFPVFNDTLRLCPFREFETRLKNSILSDDARALVGYYPAFNVAELLVLLQDHTVINDYKNAASQLADSLIFSLRMELLSAETCNSRLIE